MRPLNKKQKISDRLYQDSWQDYPTNTDVKFKQQEKSALAFY
jgi:hypothetical protein